MTQLQHLATKQIKNGIDLLDKINLYVLKRELDEAQSNEQKQEAIDRVWQILGDAKSEIKTWTEALFESIKNEQ